MATEYNRQYIGARYVPQFFNNPNGSWDWSQGFQYEPLTIVKYGENTYTSKMLVPATVGSPNLNPEYWALTGNYNGALNLLTQQVNQNTSDITALKPTVQSMSQYFTPYDLSNREILIIGDSWTQPDNSWAYQIKNKIESINKGKITISAQGGEGFNSGGFLNLLNNSPVKNYTHIIVAGYATDQSKPILSVRAAASQFYARAKELYPNAEVCYLMLSHKQQSSDNIGSLEYAMNIENFKTVRADRILGLNKYFSGDNVHPTQNGQNLLYYHLLNWFLGGKVTRNIETLDSVNFTVRLLENNINVRLKAPLASVLNGSSLSILNETDAFDGFNFALINNISANVTINGSSYVQVFILPNDANIKMGVVSNMPIEVSSMFNATELVFDRDYFGF